MYFVNVRGLLGGLRGGVLALVAEGRDQALDPGRECLQLTPCTWYSAAWTRWHLHCTSFARPWTLL